MRHAEAFQSCDFCRRQAIRVEELEEENRQLRAELSAIGYRAPREFGLSTTEETLLGMMVERDRFVSAEAMFDAIPHIKDKDDFDSFKMMAVHISKMRRKLSYYQIKIETGRHKGWRLDPESRVRLLNWNTKRAEAA